MKKLLTIVFTMLVAGSLSFAQNTGGDKAAHKGTKTEATDAASKDTKSGKKGHKGGKKSKKGQGSSGTTPPPK